MAKRFPFVTGFNDRHGKPRYRFRRKGYSVHYFRSPFGTKAFEREYAACLEAEPPVVGIDRVIPGSVGDVIARYYADTSFLDLKPATQTVYRGVLERFRDKFGNDPFKLFDAERINRLMVAMRHKPHAAARLKKLFAQLYRIARIAKIVPATVDPVKDVKAPKTEGGGYHRWTEDEMAAFEKRHPLGTKPRLAFSLLLFGAQRSGDVRHMTRLTIAGGRIALDQSKTNNAVDLPIVAPLREALDAGPLGKVLLLEAKGGAMFTEKGFYGLLKKACVAAGIPHCSPHGLRKSAARRCYLAGCSDAEGMEITGHKTLKEYRRYAGIGAKPELADAAMAKVVANLPQKVATVGSEPVERAQ